MLADARVDSLGGAVPERVALAAYQSSRDRMSMPLVSATEDVAAYDWDTGRIRMLLRQVSAAMAHELELLPTLVAGGPGRRVSAETAATAGP